MLNYFVNTLELNKADNLAPHLFSFLSMRRLLSSCWLVSVSAATSAFSFSSRRFKLSMEDDKPFWQGEKDGI